MGALKTATVSIPAGSQFTGDEPGFKVYPVRGNYLWLVEVNLQMGPEAKRFEVRKVLSDGHFVRLYQSVNRVTGNADDTTDADFYGSGADIEALCEPGDYVAVVTGDATAEMWARIYFFDGSLDEIAAFRGA